MYLIFLYNIARGIFLLYIVCVYWAYELITYLITIFSITGSYEFRIDSFFVKIRA